MRKLRRFHQSWGLVWFCVGVVGGTILMLIFRWPFFHSWVWIILVVIFFILATIWPNILCLGLAGMAGMVLSFYVCTNALASLRVVEGFVGKTIEVSGRVIGDTSSSDGELRFRLGDLEINGIEVGGNLYVLMNATQDISRDDYLRMSGTLAGGFGTYSGALYRPTLLAQARASPGNFLLVFRSWLSGRVKNEIPEEEAKLGLAYLVGERGELSEDFSANLKLVGMAHIVVASGAHLGILVKLMQKIFKKLSRFACILFTTLFVVLFMAVVGFSNSILRAGIVTILSLWGWYTGRKYAPWRIILFAMTITILINPMNMIDLAWLLSFASFAGIMILAPAINRFLYGDDKVPFVAGIIIQTISATLVTMPLSFYYFGSISLLSVLANLLILPTLPIVMGLVFASAFVPVVPGFLAKLLLDFHMGVVDFLAQQKYFLIKTPVGNAWVFLLYLVPVAAYFGIRLIPKNRVS